MVQTPEGRPALRREWNHGSEHESAGWCDEHNESTFECPHAVIPGVDDYAEELQRAADDSR